MDYGELALLSRAVLLLLRQMRGLQEDTELTTGNDFDEQVARMNQHEIDAILAEIAEAGARHTGAHQMAEDGQEATQ